MGIVIELIPIIGLGFALRFDYAILELVIGPFRIILGDADALKSLDDY